MKFLKAILLLNLALLANSSHALVMSSYGSSLLINTNETLYVNDGDVFDLASFNISSTGNLDVYGNTPNATFSIFTTGNFIVDGYLNLFVSKIFVESENITIAGTVNMQSGGEINLTAKTSIFLAGSSIINVDSLNAQVSVSTVPEMDPYKMLLAGLGILGLVSWLRSLIAIN